MHFNRKNSQRHRDVYSFVLRPPPSQLTRIIVGMGDHKHLQRLIVPLVRVVSNVEALFPYAAVRVVKLEKGVHIQHLKRDTNSS